MPAAYVAFPFVPRLIPGFSQVVWLVLALFVAFGGAIGAIRIGNRVRRMSGVDSGLAAAAVVIGWIEIVLSIVGGVILVVLAYLISHLGPVP